MFAQLIALRAALLRSHRHRVLSMMAGLRRRILEAQLHCVGDRPFLFIRFEVWEALNSLYGNELLNAWWQSMVLPRHELGAAACLTGS